MRTFASIPVRQKLQKLMTDEQDVDYFRHSQISICEVCSSKALHLNENLMNENLNLILKIKSNTLKKECIFSSEG